RRRRSTPGLGPSPHSSSTRADPARGPAEGDGPDRGCPPPGPRPSPYAAAMAEPPDQSPQPPHRSGMSLGVAVVGVLAGLLFATIASLFADSEGRQPMNLQDLVRAESERLEQTNSEVRDLQDQVDELVAEQSRANPDVAAGPALSF